MNEENYESNFVGAMLGLAITCNQPGAAVEALSEDIELALLLAEGLMKDNYPLKLAVNWQPQYEPSKLVREEPIITEAWVAVLGLFYTYSGFDKARFFGEYPKRVINPATPWQPNETMLAIAKAAYLLARREIMPEDLMSAILDVLPFDFFHPAYQKLLVAQDFLEERQTLVDNVEAGELLDVDLLQTDYKNVIRLWAKSVPTLTAYDVLAAACYLFAARKSSFEEVMDLAFSLKNTNPDLAPLLGVLAGAYHGQEAIPDAWKTNLPDYDKIVDTARRLNAVAQKQ